MAWLGTYAKRRLITVENANIDSDLTHFPIAVVLGASVGQSSQDLTDIFDEVGASYLKIAITKADGTTQIYGDVELWDDTNERAVIHVAKSDLDITSATETELYIYYDSAQADNTTYISMSGGTPAQSVWDANFSAIYHMAQDPSGSPPQLLDSTSNNNDGTSGGSMTSEDLIDGEIGKAIDSDGSDDIIDCGSGVAISPSAIHIEFYLRFGSVAGSQVLIEKRHASSTSPMPFLVYNRNNGTLAYNDATLGLKESSSFLTTATWMYLSILRTTTKVQMIQNLTQKYLSSFGSTSIDHSSSVPVYIAADKQGDSLHSNIDYGEIRISYAERSVDWMKTTYYSLTDDLLTFGTSESFSSSTALSDMAVDIAVFLSSAEDQKIDISVLGEITQDFSTDIHAAAWTSKDKKLDIAAYLQELENQKIDVSTLGEVFKDLQTDIHAAAWTSKDKKLDVATCAQFRESMALAVLAAIENTANNVVMDLWITDGDSLQDASLDIWITDGIKLQGVGLDIAVVGVMPVFKAVYAMHLDSAIKEII